MKSDLLNSIITELEQVIHFLKERIKEIDALLSEIFSIEIEKMEKIKQSLEILERTLKPKKNG